MTRSKIAFSRLPVLMALLLSLPAFGHHGWNGNGPEQVELTGTVDTTVSLNGPHARMKIMVDDQLWDITLAPPTRTQRAGLRETSIPAGAVVTVSGHRNNDPERFEMKAERVLYDGTLYDVYPDRD